MAYQVEIRNDWVERTITKTGKEGLTYRVEYYNELTQSVKRKSKKITRDTPQARRKARQLIIADIQRMYEEFEHSSVTLQELRDKYADFIDSGRSGMHYQTGYQYKFNVDKFIEDVDTTILADNIQTSYFNSYFDKLFAEGKSWSYINVRKSAISNMYQFGVDYGYLNSNPLALYKLHHKRTPAKLIPTEDKFFTPDEMRKLLNYFKEHLRFDYYDLVVWLYVTGMRVGEAVSLYPRDIIERNGKYYAKIVGTQIAVHGKDVKEHVTKQYETKTYKGTRLIELNDEAVRIYNRHKNSKSYLFVTQSKPARGLRRSAWGKPIRTNQVYLEIVLASSKLKIGKVAQTDETDSKKKKMSFYTHMLRHTYVSRCASYGIPFDLDFLEQIGHDDDKTTREIYNHINRMNKEELAKGFKALDAELS